jgi:hypothetical protein
MSTSTKLRARTRTGESLRGRGVERAANRDRIVAAACGKGWQVIKDVVSQVETEKLLRSAARRTKLRIAVNLWADGTTVTYRVTPRPTVESKDVNKDVSDSVSDNGAAGAADGSEGEG